MPGLGADESVVTLVSDCTAERRSFVVTPTCKPFPYRKVIVSVHIFIQVFAYLPTTLAVWCMYFYE